LFIAHFCLLETTNRIGTKKISKENESGEETNPKIILLNAKTTSFHLSFLAKLSYKVKKKLYTQTPLEPGCWSREFFEVEVLDSAGILNPLH
jgi:hypothetical protein